MSLHHSFLRLRHQNYYHCHLSLLTYFYHQEFSLRLILFTFKLNSRNLFLNLLTLLHCYHSLHRCFIFMSLILAKSISLIDLLSYLIRENFENYDYQQFFTDFKTHFTFSTMLHLNLMKLSFRIECGQENRHPQLEKS